MTRFLHAINFYSVPALSEGDIVQRKTLDSLIASSSAFRYVFEEDIVTCLVGNEADLSYGQRICIEKCFVNSHTELVSYTELAGLSKTKKQLPLLTDLLKPFREKPSYQDFTHLIFTNSDICLSPQFYLIIRSLIDSLPPCTALLVNRETINKELLNLEISLGYRAVGMAHPGHDCFVVPMEILGRLQLKKHIVGIGYVMRPFLLNLILICENVYEIKRSWLTFHYGDDTEWKGDEWTEMRASNHANMVSVYNDLKIKYPDKWLLKKSIIDQYFTAEILKNYD